jgi:hypothetical protein
LPAIVGSINGETGDVAARTRKTLDQAATDRIGDDRENDGDGARLLQQRRSGGCGMGKNEVGLQRDELLRELLCRLRVARCRPASVGPHVAAFRPPELPESLPERRDAGLSFWVALGIRHQHADPSHPIALLRVHGERPSGCCAADKGDEIAASHVSGLRSIQRTTIKPAMSGHL